MNSKTFYLFKCLRGYSHLTRDLTKCFAIDSTKFKFTPTKTTIDTSTTPPTKRTNTLEERLVADFGHYFPGLSGVDSKDKILDMINTSKEVAEWYREWSINNSTMTSLPPWLDKSSVQDLKTWRTLNDAREKLAKKQKDWGARVNDASRKLKDTIAEVETEKTQYFNSLDKNLLIDMVSQQHLSVDDAAKLAIIKDKKVRQDEAKKLVVALQRSLRGKTNEEILELFK